MVIRGCNELTNIGSTLSFLGKQKKISITYGSLIIVMSRGKATYQWGLGLRILLDVYLILEEKLEFPSNLALIFSSTLDRPRKNEWFKYQLFHCLLL